MRNAPSLALSIVGLFLLGGVAQADQITFQADLASAAEVPPVTSPGKGSATASLDTTTKTLTWTVTYSGLSGPATAATGSPAGRGRSGGTRATPSATSRRISL